MHRIHILVAMDAHTISQGARSVKDALIKELALAGLGDEVRVVETGSLGIYDKGVVLVIFPDGIYYVGVRMEDVSEIISEHLIKGRVVERLQYLDIPAAEGQMGDKPARVGKQLRVVLKNAGVIDPESIEEYIAHDGYEALGKALTGMKPEEVMEEVKKSGLQGRGGAFFPTGLKWSFAAKEKSDIKYIICNADEGEPGTFKDRLILEGDPHAVIEGMALAGYAVGACQGYIYIRGEYHMSIARMQRAIDQARSQGLLGENIFGSGFSFDLEIREGAGAYICGEETALIESIEGKRGEPRNKPPFPPSVGLWGKPTIVNNVETLANIPQILFKGAEWYKGIGTAKSPGTKVFTMVGNINNPGLIEVPMGITLREIIYDIGHGIPGGKGFKMAQLGGTTGGILTSEHLDLPLSTESLREIGAGMGSGALLVVDDSQCTVGLVKNFVEFFVHESCGICTLCREGNGRLLEILERLTSGHGAARDLDLMEELARTMTKGAFCGLGQAAPIPILGCMRYFRGEFEQHLAGTCKAGRCNLQKSDQAAA
ncbi:MAG TPA: NADH-quinone oxidoreductase subunit NuoF [bacterium]|nr:NADH-quinone oxidoreductase subunit NuoF [bacterium]HQG46084.1 NADH-quinone oxidoreductase subunit NuoF [bacterium]HQI49321.1 NADH-quinone oxidoreductase subunit NuoF [bacterium]HQJ64703.1 NADH-quinone oxidoreductase subunit NuoF [bacterium]